MGIDAMEHFDHAENGVSNGKGQTFVLPHVLNDVKPEQSRSGSEPYLLDVACGPTGWTVDLTYKDSMPHIDAADYWRWMAEYVRSLVWRLELWDAREAMHTMLQMCERFPTSRFDGVHLSYVSGYTPDEESSRLLKELVRLCRAGGTIRWMEGALPATNSVACQRLFMLAAQALAATGRSFYGGKSQLSFHAAMETRLRDAGCHALRVLPVGLNVSAGSVVHYTFVQEMLATIMLLKPLVLRMRQITNEEHMQLVKQMRQDLRAPTFRGTCYIYTVWGNV